MLKFICCIIFLLPFTAVAGNLHKLDEGTNGFAIYRSGRPNETEFKEWCQLGITEVLVLSGTSDKVEKSYSELCPNLRVIKEEHQDPQIPLSVEFLNFFDWWVVTAQKEGKKILFRCECGCHRTGRLSAYYEMKYLKKQREEVIKDLLLYGENMESFPFIPSQIDGLRDFIDGRPCRFREPGNIKSYCPSP